MAVPCSVNASEIGREGEGKGRKRERGRGGTTTQFVQAIGGEHSISYGQHRGIGTDRKCGQETGYDGKAINSATGKDWTEEHKIKAIPGNSERFCLKIKKQSLTYSHKWQITRYHHMSSKASYTTKHFHKQPTPVPPVSSLQSVPSLSTEKTLMSM